jgi:hypothetical protein
VAFSIPLHASIRIRASSSRASVAETPDVCTPVTPRPSRQLMGTGADLNRWTHVLHDVRSTPDKHLYGQQPSKLAQMLTHQNPQHPRVPPLSRVRNSSPQHG